MGHSSGSLEWTRPIVYIPGPASGLGRMIVSFPGGTELLPGVPRIEIGQSVPLTFHNSAIEEAGQAGSSFSRYSKCTEISLDGTANSRLIEVVSQRSTRAGQ